MTKAAAVRSILRRRVLVKAADDYASLMNGYANAHRPGLVGAGVRVAVNDNLRKTNPPARPSVPAAASAPAPAKAPQSGVISRLKAVLARR